MIIFFDSSEYVTAESLRAESRVRNNERSITGSADLYRGKGFLRVDELTRHVQICKRL